MKEKDYMVYWTEHHSIQVLAKDEDEAKREAMKYPNVDTLDDADFKVEEA